MASDPTDGDAKDAQTPRSAGENDAVGRDAEIGTADDSSSIPAVSMSKGEGTAAAEDTAPGSDTASTDKASPSYPPALIATAVALPVVLVVGIIVAAVLARNMPVEREPLALGPVPAPAAEGETCLALLPALPAELGEYTKATLVEPAPQATRAWQPEDGGDPIVLRCGLDRPLEFHRASPLQVVNGVQWFQVRDDVAATGTWFAVDRETYIALTVPDAYGPTPLQVVSDTIATTLPAKDIDPGPLPN